ncbi:MAG TPA: hypothetical protein VHA35_06435 [Dongiaceae bacterium]|nr:hypothetical protein [Dongiaceae bacterium]
MSDSELPTPQYANKMKAIGRSDQGGRPDAVQVMVAGGYAYVGHLFSNGFSVIDVRDPRRPKALDYYPAPANTWNLHLQAHEDLLLVVHAKNMWAQAELADERNYYRAKTTDIHRHAAGSEQQAWSAGLAVYDISNKAKPTQIGFMPIKGGGLHRVWYVGGRWAYASALIEGFSDYIMIVIDLADPAHPREYGRFWLPGMNLAAGETLNWPSASGRYGCHHPIVHGDIAYCSWRDACLVVVDLADRAKPKLLAHRMWSPQMGGATHNCLPLPKRELLLVLDEATLDEMEDGYKPIWVFDNKDPANPRCLSTFPAPSDRNYVEVGGHFGPHNVYENRPGNFVSEDLIFTTYQNAGVRVFDIRNQYAPVEVGAYVQAAPKKLVDPRPNRPLVLHAADVFVDKNGLVYATDFSVGLYILEYNG